MSEVKVDTISERTAAGGVTIDGVLIKDNVLKIPGGSPGADKGLTSDASGNATWEDAAVGGKILQVLQSVKTDTATTTVAGGTWADIAGTDQAAAGAIWCVKITPSATTSKILCMFTVTYGAGSSTNRRINLRLLRDSATPVLGDAASSRIPVTTGGLTTASEGLVNGGFIYLDLPSSTAELTYKVQWDIYASGNTVYLNRAYTDTDSDEFSRGTSQITVMEIGA